MRVNCLICKKEIQRTPYKIKRAKHIFCSKQCQNRSLINRTMVGLKNKENIKRLWKNPKYRIHMIEAKLNNPVRYWLGKVRPEISDNKHYKWKGDDVKYHGLHHWVAKKLGTPNTCEHCGKSGLKGRQIHWANKSHQYKRDLNDWIRLCRMCHATYDGITVGGVYATN